MGDGLTPITPVQEANQEKKTAEEGYVHRLLVAFDQFVNVATDGHPDETISSRAARAAEQGDEAGILLTKFLDIFQSDHGVKAQAGDEERAKAVLSIEQNSGFTS